MYNPGKPTGTNLQTSAISRFTFGRTIIAGTLFLAMIVLFTGCATYSTKLATLKPELSSGQFDKALLTVEENTGSKDRLLYFLERGMILHFADRWVESNEAFAAADRLAENLYTKSISEGVFSLFSNDNAISFRARPYEMAMVPYYKALNYIYMGQREGALVEARRASELLSKYIDVTLDGVRDEDKSDLDQTRNNAFLLYFSGMLYDWDGEINDAFIAYRNAAVAYQQNSFLLGLQYPATLAADLTRLADRLGFQQELEDLHKSCPDVFGIVKEAKTAATVEEYEAAVSNTSWQSGNGEIALLLETGYVPQKVEERFDFPIFANEDYDDPDYWSWELAAGLGNMRSLARGRKVTYWVSVAAPALQDSPVEITGARVSAGVSGSHVNAIRVDNLSRSARVTFDAEKPSIIFKTILRGLTKYLASQGAEEAAGKWGKLVGNLFGAVTESADTRSWLTLPQHINLARLSLPPGTYDLQVELLGAGGRPVETRLIKAVEVRSGDWTFLSRRMFQGK